jgi:hypothetical protein
MRDRHIPDRVRYWAYEMAEDDDPENIDHEEVNPVDHIRELIDTVVRQKDIDYKVGAIGNLFAYLETNTPFLMKHVGFRKGVIAKATEFLQHPKVLERKYIACSIRSVLSSIAGSRRSARIAAMGS